MLLVVVVWCVLVVLFTWFGKGTGPRRVFKALGYATATLLIPTALFIGGLFGFAYYKDAKDERIWAEKAPDRAAEYEKCVAESKAQSVRSIVNNKQAGIKPDVGGEYITDIDQLRELNGCPSE